MPDWTEDEIREAIDNGRLSLLSIDTNIFHKYNYGLEYGLLKRMSQFVDTEVEFVLSDIILRELKSHMVEAGKEAGKKFTAGLKAIGGCWNIAAGIRDEAATAVLRGKTAEIAIAERITSYQKETDFKTVEVAGLVEVDELITRYFESKPPFEKKDDKKHEFPDALALMSLEQYAANGSAFMLVVSADKGWVEFCKHSPQLVCIGDLGTAMSYFQRVPSVVSATLAERFSAGQARHLTEAVIREVGAYIEDNDFEVEASSAYYFDPEIEEKKLRQVDFDEASPFILVEADDQQYVFEVAVSAVVEFTCGFSFSMWDGVDREYIPFGSNTVTIVEALPFSLTVTIEVDQRDEFEVVEIQVIESQSTVYFGDVDPDWGGAED